MAPVLPEFFFPWIWLGDSLLEEACFLGSLQAEQHRPPRGFFRVHKEHVQNSPFLKVISLPIDNDLSFEPQHTSQHRDFALLTSVHFLQVQVWSLPASSPEIFEISSEFMNFFFIVPIDSWKSSSRSWSSVAKGTLPLPFQWNDLKTLYHDDYKE